MVDAARYLHFRGDPPYDWLECSLCGAAFVGWEESPNVDELREAHELYSPDCIEWVRRRKMREAPQPPPPPPSP